MASRIGTPSAEALRRPSTGLWRDHPALMAAVTYGAISLTYIALSDQIVSWLVQDHDRLTLIQTYKGWAFISITTVLIFFLVRHGVNEARAAQRERIAVDERYRRMIETTNEGVWVVDDTGRTEYMNQTMASMLGYLPQEMIGRDLRDFAVAAHREVLERALQRRSAGEAQRFDCEFNRRDDTSVWGICSLTAFDHNIQRNPRKDRDGGALLMVTDITTRKTAERALADNLDVQRGLLNELDHRVRNNLSSLSSLIDLSRSSSGSVDEFARTIGGRVQAMAKAHALAGQAASEGMDLRRVLEEMVPPRLRARIAFEGPAVGVDGHQIIPLAMLMHEMLSRSGALNSSDGRAKVRWDSAGGAPSEATVEMRWIETPPPATLAEPQADIVAGLVRSDLRGEIEATADGHRLRLTLQQPQSMNA